jgi:hypothetical protein
MHHKRLKALREMLAMISRVTKCKIMSTLIVGGLTILTASQAVAVTWEVQAERLQMVSASFLDAQPLLSSANGDGSQFRIEAKAVVSVLPKMNATVGGKTEQPPQPPAHSIPTLELGYIMPQSILGKGVIRLWQGFLPADSGKKIGMNASCGQTLTGFSLGLRNDEMNFVSASVDLGQQWNNTKVEGGITEPNAKDLFRVKTKLQFVALTVSPKILRQSWIQAQVTERKISTHFEIPSDGTTFDLTDEGSIRRGSAATQFSFGYDIGSGLQAAVAYLNTPQRSTIPRVLFSYSKTFGGKDSLFAWNDGH